MDEILEKAERDAEKYRTIYKGAYADGGSKEYHYNDYTILKFNDMTIPIRNQEDTLMYAYNKDLYIGNPSMNINNLNKLYYNNI